MSLGPTTTEKTELSRFTRLRYEAKKTLETYFKDPVHYLFYSMLGMTILGLFFGMSFAFEYYAILIGLMGFTIYKSLQKK